MVRLGNICHLHFLSWRLIRGFRRMRVSTALAGVERLAFSITWDLTPKGKILAQWAGRSIIRSCVKLAYGHAQDMIEGKFAGLPDQETPSVELHGYTWPEVCPSSFPCLLFYQIYLWCESCLIMRELDNSLLLLIISYMSYLRHGGRGGPLAIRAMFSALRACTDC